MKEKFNMCKECGIKTKQQFCGSCGADLTIANSKETTDKSNLFDNDPRLETKDEVEYAGFWKRFGAYLIDGLIVGAFSYGITIGISFSVILLGFYEDWFILSVQAVTIICAVLYFPIFESSKFQATPGKMALAIKVTDTKFKRITFWHALGRYILKTLSSLTLYIGYMMAGFTEKKQALHDIIAKTYVINRD